MGTFRIQAKAIITQSGSYTLFSNPVGLSLLQIINTFPLNSNDFWRSDASGSIILLPDLSGIFLDGSSTPIDENHLPIGFNVSAAQIIQAGQTNGDSSAFWTLQLGARTSGINSASFAYQGIETSLNDVLVTNFGINQSTNVGISSCLMNYTQITGSYNIISSSWIINNLTHPGSTFRVGDTGQITSNPSGTYDFSAVTSVTVGAYTITSFTIQTPIQIQFIIPPITPSGSSQPITITNPGQFSGDALVGVVGILIPDASGVYTVIPGATHDTVYVSSQTDGTTENVAIPTPGVSSGFLGG